MANHKSAIKEHGQSLKARDLNRYKKARMRTAVKKIRRAVVAGEGDNARALLLPTLSLIDQSAKHGVIHDNAAARTKSRLTRAVARIG